MRAHLTPLLAAPLLAAGAMTALALPAAAQPAYADGPYVDEVIVSPLDRNVSRLSQRVSFSDLDLTTRAGQHVLRLRIKDTARDLCRALGEGPGNGGPLMASCEDQAVRDARPQVRRAVAYAFAHPPVYAYNDVGEAYAWNSRVWP